MTAPLRRVVITRRVCGDYMRWRTHFGGFITVPLGAYLVVEEGGDCVLLAAELSPNQPSNKHFYRVAAVDLAAPRPSQAVNVSEVS